MMYRWPDELEGVDWDYGVPKAYIEVSSPSLLTSAQAQVSHVDQSGTIAAHRCPMSLVDATTVPVPSIRHMPQEMALCDGKKRMAR